MISTQTMLLEKSFMNKKNYWTTWWFVLMRNDVRQKEINEQEHDA